jgi:TolB-like protein/Tfp pilus assembly protein PilF
LSLFQEFKRRNVFRAAIAYLALAWLLIEVAGTVLPGFGVPDWAFRFVVIVLALGFVPVLIFSWAYEITPEGVKREKDVVRDESITSLTARRLDFLTIGLVVVALGVLLADRLWLGRQTAQISPAQPASEQPALLNSIAVLPFANRSDRPEDVFFVDGIHDDLLTYVSQIGSIKTISRTSVMKYRDSTLSIPKIAQELGVATVLEGGVQRAGDQVRINVQLIDARTDDHLWSKIYDRQLTAANVFSIQSEIARAIAEALRAELTPEAQHRLDSVPTENLEALEAYFLGRQSMATRRVTDLAEAVDYFETAISEDPDFALAHAGMSLASALYENYSGLTGDERQVWLDKAQAAADRSLQLDPGLSTGYAASGLIKWYIGEFENSVSELRHAIRLNPNDVQAHQWLGRVLTGPMSQTEEGLVHAMKAVTLDPKSAIILADYGDGLNAAGRHDEALAQFRLAVAIEPRFSKGYRRIGQTLVGLGTMDEAISAFWKAADIEPESWVISRDLGSAYLALGDDKRAESWFEKAMTQAPGGLQQVGVYLGLLYLFRGEPDQAAEYLDAVLAEQPENQLALYMQVNLDIADGNIKRALTLYEESFPELFAVDPDVGPANHVVAIHLTALLSRTGEVEQMGRLLELAEQEIEAYAPRHLGDEAAIHALRGDDRAALEILASMDNSEKTQSWRQFVVSHPAFQSLRESPEFQALDQQFEAEMADQLIRVRAMEAREEAPVQ